MDIYIWLWLIDLKLHKILPLLVIVGNLYIYYYYYYLIITIITIWLLLFGYYW